ncbi:MAG TPA: D-glycero-beta-D-manno-heptose-7-phosphate kinase [Candidatus Krumholzibacteria bacterium]|nr:D-glycero-beta-D-manno-heptose-7-phosphate kinase [Candidatus Krumholzibacteria bacterium]HPD71480.1 D-glycero-beta-D-manno-heptose-7-phosphate kinase [Candidatus Krumholzibacteria bacterium]HRY41587.1 D-glycero-beta-D-manno-heptose-7-phosphate kinase [Candidatus Krumholzibacteria bacterium]
MTEKFKEILAEFPRLRLAVVGDIMVDRFLWGRCDRISPEAPVPVVRLQRETLQLGGAANVAANLHALGVGCGLIGVCGQDEAGASLRTLLGALSLAEDGLIALGGRPTTMKTRIIAQNQQVVRADLEDDRPLAAAETAQVVARLRSLGPFDGVVLSDYGKGVLTEPVLAEIIALGRERGGIVVVDPKKGDYSQYRGVTSLTPNQREAELACALSIVDAASLARAGRLLCERTAAECVLITRGEHGMSLFERDGTEHHLPTEATEVYDVTGAGDTVIAVYTAALCAGASFREAAGLANHAAGVAVREVGTVAVTRDQLERAVGAGRD